MKINEPHCISQRSGKGVDCTVLLIGMHLSIKIMWDIQHFSPKTWLFLKLPYFFHLHICKEFWCSFWQSSTVHTIVYIILDLSITNINYFCSLWHTSKLKIVNYHTFVWSSFFSGDYQTPMLKWWTIVKRYFIFLRT